MKQMMFFFSVIFLFCVYRIEAQEAPKTPPIWLGRAQVETSQLAELAFGYSKYNQAILFGRIGEMWARTDELRGREWLQKAADLLTFVSLQESVYDHQLHLSAIRNVLRNVGSLDPSITKRLVDTMLSISKLPALATDKQNLGNSLLNTARVLANTDPARSKELALVALGSEGTNNLLGFLALLRRKDQKIADDFFLEALGLARSLKNDEILRSMLLLIAITEDGQELKSQRIPAKLQEQAMKALLERIEIVPTTAETREMYCQFVSNTVIWHRQRVASLIPAGSALVDQSIATCQQAFAADSIEGRAMAQTISGKKLPEDPRDLFEETPKTADDFLSLARKATVMSERVKLLLLAAKQAERENAPEQGLHILETMTTDERNAVDGWERLLSALTVTAVLKRLVPFQA